MIFKKKIFVVGVVTYIIIKLIAKFYGNLLKKFEVIAYIYIKLGIFWMFTWALDVQIGHFLGALFECLSKAKAFYKG